MIKLAWGDTLLGFEIKPEAGAWQDGLYEMSGNWCKHGAGMNTDSTRAHWREISTPIYPPRGWKDKSETEIWDAIVGTDDGEPITLQFSDIVEIGHAPLYISYHYDIEGFVPQAHGEKIGAWLQERIQALQNAQVLSERLRND